MGHGSRIGAGQLSKIACRLTAHSIARLSDQNLLKTLSQEAESFWPAKEANLERMGEWLVMAQEPMERMPGHQQDLEPLRLKPRPYSEADRDRDTAALREELEALLKFWQTLPEDQRTREDFERQEIEAAISERRSRLQERRTWLFTDSGDTTVSASKSTA